MNLLIILNNNENSFLMKNYECTDNISQSAVLFYCDPLFRNITLVPFEFKDRSSKANDETEYNLKRLKTCVHPKGSIVNYQILIDWQVLSLLFCFFVLFCLFLTVVTTIHSYFSHVNEASEDV